MVDPLFDRLVDKVDLAGRQVCLEVEALGVEVDDDVAQVVLDDVLYFLSEMLVVGALWRVRVDNVLCDLLQVLDVYLVVLPELSESLSLLFLESQFCVDDCSKLLVVD